ncbi:MAG: 3-dehydroquinate synthase [Ilumatobacteraceae bacterium]|nr:3-dehydroquinate synthase [Ilumatobacteraceae bacterium]
MSDSVEEIVNLGDRSYSVVVGHGVLLRTKGMIPASARRVAIVTQDGIPPQYIPVFSELEVSTHIIGAGESHKTLSTVERLCREFSQAGLTRGDVIVAVGGGMVTDVAGFAAASYHRGIPIVHVATSLLAMIDAAVGGKTGVNIAEGKNLVGAYWQPHGVVCEMNALDTLPERELRCGLGEMAKYHFIVREDLSSLSMVDRVARCVRIKADIVSADEREGGIRALLNYGHTLAHALEIASDFSIAHGEAVAIGLLYAAHLAHRMGRIDSARVDQHYEVVHGLYGLHHSLPSGITPDQLIVDIGRDKKAIDSITFVLDSPTGLEVVSGVSEDLIRLALSDLALRLDNA